MTEMTEKVKYLDTLPGDYELAILCNLRGNGRKRTHELYKNML